MEIANSEPSEGETLAGLLATVVRSPSVGLHVVELAGELIAEHARFNKWAYERKSRSTAIELWNIAALADGCYSDCLSAWRNFVTASADKQGKLDEFQAVVSVSLNKLRSAREDDSVDFDDPSMPQELREWL